MAAHLDVLPNTPGRVMCTYQTATVAVAGSGKGADGWFPLTAATVYLDHPVHAAPLHTLNIDFRNPERGPAARVAVELDPSAARDLAESILAMLASAPPGLIQG
ncbi:MAG: hypothetical protein JWO88_3102 [Frankiales bacterium]|nr:hypothetical protein [Frankiales bacterium]